MLLTEFIQTSLFTTLVPISLRISVVLLATIKAVIKADFNRSVAYLGRYSVKKSLELLICNISAPLCIFVAYLG